ncbi:MAG: hypothetical protein WCG34_08200 [Leptolinea sp.]
MKTLNRLTITLKLVALLVTAAMFYVPPVLACTIQSGDHEDQCGATPQGQDNPVNKSRWQPRFFLYNEVFQFWPAGNRLHHTLRL